MAYFKHNNGQPKKQSQKKPPKRAPEVAVPIPTPALQHELNYVDGMGGIEQALDCIAQGA